MTDLLLYASERSQLTDFFIWTTLIAVLVFSVILIFWQRKQGKDLKDELQQLDGLEKQNVQIEFVMKAMCIATWHMDVQSQKVFYDFDFREGKKEWIHDTSVPNDYQTNLGLLQEQDAARVAQSMQDLLQGKIDVYHEEYRIVSPQTGNIFWEESYATVSERNVDGSARTIVGTSKRIDERKTMEDALVEARYRAEESDRLKTAFLANMSHEIRTPLNAIVGFTSVLPDVQDADERKALLDLVHDNTQKLLRIVDDVVTISKIESGKLEAVMSAFDLPMVLLDIVGQYEPNVKPGVELTTNFASTSQMITTDLNRLQETVSHLLSNATKFTDRGSIVVGFDKPQDGRIKIWVRDTGKGIAPEHQKQIFERFFKVDDFIPGAGLGLSTCQTMAYSMGGTVTCESKLGEGSLFTFEIPIS